jgi:polysaccharide deacetylase family protein (PEP-CTERM system associated)
LDKVVFSVDVEDGISIAMRDAFGIEISQTEQVLRCTQKILALLDQHDVKATFFILGKVGRDYPGLIKDISEAGHELAIHGFNHFRFDQLTPDEAFIELSTAKKLIEDISGQQIYGHRAPAFSVMPHTSWALQQIKLAGFEYDSSIMPCKTKNYGWPNFPKEITEINFTNNTSLYEIPMNTTTILNKETPFLGGSYFRLLPYLFLRKKTQKTIIETPGIFYMHPYEIDTKPYPDYYFKELNKSPLLTNMKMRSMWLRRNTVEDKIKKLLGDFSFIPMRQLLENTISTGSVKTISYDELN